MDNQALRPSAVSHYTDEQQDLEAVVEEQQVQQEENELAAVIDHPAWKRVEEMFHRDIRAFKEGANIDFKAYDDAALGQVLRAEHMVAERLQGYLAKIANVVQATEERVMSDEPGEE